MRVKALHPAHFPPFFFLRMSDQPLNVILWCSQSQIQMLVQTNRQAFWLDQNSRATL